MKGNLKTRLQGAEFGHQTWYLDYSDNFISYIHSLFFKRANLTFLNISNNFLGHQLRREDSKYLLFEQKFLNILDLSANGIPSLPHDFFYPFVRLEILDLSNNDIEDITFSLKHLQGLQQLNLRNNRLKTFTHKTMSELDSIATGHLMIDIRENVLLCSCDSLNFLTWMTHHLKNSKIVFKHSSTYACTFPNSTKGNFSELPDIISRLEKECASYIGVIIASVYRCHCDTYNSVWWGYYTGIDGGFDTYITWQNEATEEIVRAQNGHYRNMFLYDAFISYSSDDRMFAVHQFRQHIENQGFRLCFHERDFIPGFDIAENIANAIHDSRKVICVLSGSFLTSSWCMYEFNMALMERIHRPDGENMLFLVRLNDFDTTKAPLAMLQFIRDTTYATDEFPEDESSQDMFWTKIGETIAMD